MACTEPGTNSITSSARLSVAQVAERIALVGNMGDAAPATATGHTEMFNLKGKTAIVTGAGKGLGER